MWARYGGFAVRDYNNKSVSILIESSFPFRSQFVLNHVFCVIRSYYILLHQLCTSDSVILTDIFCQG